MAAVVTFRPAETADEPAVNLLLCTAGLMELDAGAQFGPQYTVAFGENSQLVGAAGVELYGNDALLRSVAVASTTRSQGIGLALTRNRVEWCRGQRVRAIYLLTTTSAAFFARIGFEIVARNQAPDGIAGSHQWASACPASSTAMRLMLG